MIRAGAALLWLGVGIAKMAALVLFIDGNWQHALMALIAAWAAAAFAVWLRHLQRA